MELNEEQQKKFDKIRLDFKDRLIEDNFDYDDFEICEKSEEVDDKSKDDSGIGIRIGSFEVSSKGNNNNLQEIEDCMNRFIDKCEKKSISYVGWLGM